MATIQDVLNAIATRDAAEATRIAAQGALETADSLANADIAAESATFDAAVTTFETARNAARANHGFSAAFGAHQDAITASENALYEMRTVMLEFANAIV